VGDRGRLLSLHAERVTSENAVHANFVEP
jgi:hypothetical protein